MQQMSVLLINNLPPKHKTHVIMNTMMSSGWNTLQEVFNLTSRHARVAAAGEAKSNLKINLSDLRNLAQLAQDIKILSDLSEQENIVDWKEKALSVNDDLHVRQLVVEALPPNDTRRSFILAADKQESMLQTCDRLATLVSEVARPPEDNRSNSRFSKVLRLSPAKIKTKKTVLAPKRGNQIKKDVWDPQTRIGVSNIAVWKNSYQNICTKTAQRAHHSTKNGRRTKGRDKRPEQHQLRTHPSRREKKEEKDLQRR